MLRPETLGTLRSPSAATTPRLAVYLALGYALLILYATLHPLSGWQHSGLPVFDYLTAPFPRYYRVEDLVVNVLGYVPLGFVTATALPMRRLWAVVVATLLAGLLSFSVETLQNFLPTRIASNVDLGCNIAGAFIGALAGVAVGHRLFDRDGWLQRWRNAYIIRGRSGDAGLILLCLWLLTQLMPESIVLASGDLRALLGLGTPLAFDPARFMLFETLLVSISLVAVGLIARCMMTRASALSILTLLALALAAKSLATWSFFVPGTASAWLTPGARNGLLFGLPLLAVALMLPRLAQHALAGMLLLAATTLANLIPDNPFLAVDQRLLARGNFLNFHGLTHIVASTWPFLALGYLSALGLWRGEHLDER